MNGKKRNNFNNIVLRKKKRWLKLKTYKSWTKNCKADKNNETRAPAKRILIRINKNVHNNITSYLFL